MAESRLKVSALAEQDLRDVYTEGFETWGEEQADRYYDDLIAHFGKLGENPYLYMAVDDIRAGYRRSVCGKHAVYYRIQDDAVEIMAVLKRQNPFYAFAVSWRSDVESALYECGIRIVAL